LHPVSDAPHNALAELTFVGEVWKQGDQVHKLGLSDGAVRSIFRVDGVVTFVIGVRLVGGSEGQQTCNEP
jgi:hypothetical protein